MYCWGPHNLTSFLTALWIPTRRLAAVTQSATFGKCSLARRWLHDEVRRKGYTRRFDATVRRNEGQSVAAL